MDLPGCQTNIPWIRFFDAIPSDLSRNWLQDSFSILSPSDGAFAVGVDSSQTEENVGAVCMTSQDDPEYQTHVGPELASPTPNGPSDFPAVLFHSRWSAGSLTTGVFWGETEESRRCPESSCCRSWPRLRCLRQPSSQRERLPRPKPGLPASRANQRRKPRARALRRLGSQLHHSTNPELLSLYKHYPS